MILACGKFFFRYRNAVFPIVGAMMVIDFWPIFPTEQLRVAACWLGLAVAIFGIAVRAMTVGLAYIKRGGKNKEVYAKTLVQAGMFAHCRNPLYFGNVLIAIGVGLVSNSLLFLVVGLPFFLFAYYAIVRVEEAYLREHFGAEYADYSQRVNRFIPNPVGLGATLHGMEFSWQRVVAKEYALIYQTLAGCAALLIKYNLQHRGYSASQRQVFGLTIAIAVLTVLMALAWRLKKTRAFTAD